jgi:hypothetical protein
MGARSSGDLWIGELAELWEWLRRYRTLGNIASVHRGIEWQPGRQTSAMSLSPKKGWVPGISAANSVHAFAIPHNVYLDVRPQILRGGAINFAWSEGKILANAVRLSRGPWCLAAAADRDKLIVSQQLYGIWPEADVSLESLAAVLNGPLANAFAAVHSPKDRIRLGTLSAIPIPESVPHRVTELAKLYTRVVSQGIDFFSAKRVGQAEAILDQIDALVLKAYDLPPRLEKELLEYFRTAKRPTVHEWKHWLPDDFVPCIPLHEVLSEQYKVATRSWIKEVFTPLPPNEAAALREFMD